MYTSYFSVQIRQPKHMITKIEAEEMTLARRLCWIAQFHPIKSVWSGCRRMMSTTRSCLQCENRQAFSVHSNDLFCFMNLLNIFFSDLLRKLAYPLHNCSMQINDVSYVEIPHLYTDFICSMYRIIWIRKALRLTANPHYLWASSEWLFPFFNFLLTGSYWWYFRSGNTFFLLLTWNGDLNTKINRFLCLLCLFCK